MSITIVSRTKQVVLPEVLSAKKILQIGKVSIKNRKLQNEHFRTTIELLTLEVFTTITTLVYSPSYNNHFEQNYKVGMTTIKFY